MRFALSVPESSRSGRSLTVSALAWLGIVSGVLGCIGAVYMVFTPRHALRPLGLLGSVALLVAAIGLRNRKNWARLAYIAAAVGGIANFAIRRIMYGWGGVPLDVVLYGLIIAKLCSRSVREEFEALE